MPERNRTAVLTVAVGVHNMRETIDNLLGIHEAALRTYRLEGPPFRFAKAIEPPELLE